MHYTSKEYAAIHEWVRSQLGSPTKCSNCKQKKMGKWRMHWANLSGEYKRDTMDWAPLCPRCHKGYDSRGVMVVPGYCVDGHLLESSNVYLRSDKRYKTTEARVECRKCRSMARYKYNHNIGAKA